NWTLWIVISLLIITAVIVYVMVQKQKNPGVFPLKQGSRGEEVRKLQEWLNKQNAGITIAVDGIFGPKTESLLFAVTGAKEISSKEYKSKIA
ncbi:MAG TPA: peptidoglycan-binding domain-containing protein, partial [Bacteroidales bacterium]|nr:peptidoglycan-binding domain-containing protein [Bacteroidales bacterium]